MEPLRHAIRPPTPTAAPPIEAVPTDIHRARCSSPELSTGAPLGLEAEAAAGLHGCRWPARGRNARAGRRAVGIKRFVHTSSIATIGYRGTEPATEDDPFDEWHGDDYVRSNYAAELLLPAEVLPLRDRDHVDRVRLLQRLLDLEAQVVGLVALELENDDALGERRSRCSETKENDRER